MPVLDCFSLKEKVALVTGGAGLYGRQIVTALAEAGAQVVMASRHQEILESLAEGHRRQGYDITALGFDQGKEDSILALKDIIVRRCGRLDILVNNSVLRPMKKGFHDKASTFAESMKVNATGLFIITRAFGDLMAERQQGSIINIGSIQGMIGPDPAIYRGTTMNGWYPDYFFHKGGMINFTRFLASYYGTAGIRCNCIAPGGFLTAQMPEAFVRQ